MAGDPQLGQAAGQQGHPGGQAQALWHGRGFPGKRRVVLGTRVPGGPRGRASTEPLASAGTLIRAHVELGKLRPFGV